MTHRHWHRLARLLIRLCLAFLAALAVLIADNVLEVMR